MKTDRLDTFRIVLQATPMKIIKSIEKEPKRFSELSDEIPNERTLALNISKLVEIGVIETIASKKNGKYVNCYALSEKGRKIMEMFEKWR